MLKNISLERAEAILKERLPAVTIEEVNLLKGLGRVLAKDIISPIDQPPFNRSPLDGYALKASDLKNVSRENPAKLKVIEKIFAGDFPKKEIESGTATRIMTGAPIPVGADCVVRQEDTEEKAGYVNIFTTLLPWQNYCFKGEDFKKGQVILKEGSLLNSNKIGTLASLGFSKVLVYKKPQIGILSTGSELIDIGRDLLPGKIYNSNLYNLAARIEELGGEPILLGIAQDTPENLKEKIKEGIKKSDILLTTGGVSVGEKDILQEVLKSIGAEILFWRVKIKPGTPVLCSILDEKLVISLSGNPGAAINSFELLVHPLLAELTQREDLRLKRRKAILQDDFSKKSKIRRFIRGIYTKKSDKSYVNITQAQQSPGALSSTLDSNCLIDIPEGSPPLKKGEVVEVILI